MNTSENFISKTILIETGKNLTTLDINNHITYCNNTIAIMTKLKKILNKEERQRKQQQINNIK